MTGHGNIAVHGGIELTSELNSAKILRPGETPSRILIVEDERIVALDLGATLNYLGYTVTASVSTGEAAITESVRLRPDLVLMDIRLAGEIDGIQAAEAIRKQVDIPVIYLTAHSDDPTLARARNSGPFGYLVKPFKAPDLHCAIEIALHKHEIETKLRERELWLATTLRSIADGVVATDSENRVTFLNPVAEALTGWLAAQAVGRIANDILSFVSDHNPPNLAGPPDGALPGQTMKAEQATTKLVSKSGKAIPVDESAAPILDDAGHELGKVIVFRDISERRQAEAEVRKLNAELELRVVERTAQLEAANKELDSFNYSIAHDLRSPLRGIDAFSVLLVENHTANLGPEALECLNRIRAGVERMRQLIDDLLRLSRVAQCDYRPQKVDLTEIATRISAELQATSKNRQAEFLVQGGITIEGDSSLLRIALENLLSNAWKFTSKTGAPKIEFGSTVEQGKQVCYVRDNGVGFDMKYADKLFGVFQRLHSGKEFEGTGVGLAIVERIIHRHGGHIWAESLPGKGATFYFTV
jgi:PAS domain S-box-containing protein